MFTKEEAYNQISSLVQRFNEQLPSYKKLNQLEARIKYTDDKINQLVFDLYGLNEEEREVVEG